MVLRSCLAREFEEDCARGGNEAQDQLSQQGNDNHALTLRHQEGDSIKGYLSVITTGRNANGNVVIDAGNKFQAEFGLGEDQQSTFLPDEVKTELGSEVAPAKSISSSFLPQAGARTQSYRRFGLVREGD